MAASDEEFVEGPQRAEGEVDGGAPEFPLAEMAEEGAEVIALKGGPGGLRLPRPRIPAGQFGQGLGVVAVRVAGCGTVGGEVGEELRAPRVRGLLSRFWRAHGGRVVAEGQGCERGVAGRGFRGRAVGVQWRRAYCPPGGSRE